jgi:hypothetical protein
LFIEYVPLYSPDILSWVEKPFGSPLDPSRAGASAAVYGLLLLLILFVAPSGAAGLVKSALKSFTRWSYTRRGTDSAARGTDSAAS